MTKINPKCLGLNRTNFNINIKSKRISKIRLGIQFKINCLKNRFKKKRKLIFNNLNNSDAKDIISHQIISKYDLLILFINNCQYGFSASNLIKWMSTFTGEYIPTNPLTNLPLNYYDRQSCYQIAINFLDRNIKCNLDFEENNELREKLEIFRQYEIFRLNPDLIILVYYSLIYKLEEELSEIFDCPSNTNFCLACLQNYDSWAFENTPENIIHRVKTIGYSLEAYKYKIEETENKIMSNYFI